MHRDGRRGNFINPVRSQRNARLDEYLCMRPEPGRDELSLLETALFMEEAFGIRLSDAEIVFDELGTKEALQLLLDRKLGEA